jgi:hypothetical protein
VDSTGFPVYQADGVIRLAGDCGGGKSINATGVDSTDCREVYDQSCWRPRQLVD